MLGISLALWPLCLAGTALAQKTPAAPAKAPAHDHHHHAHDETPPPTDAVCIIMAMDKSEAHGSLMLKQEKGDVHITGEVSGLKPGLHGMHIHMFGDLRSKDGSSAGGHFNPDGHKHGGLETKEHHAGDLGNIKAGDDGTAKVDVKANGVHLHFILGRSIVVHEKEDDLKTDPSGNSGGRIGVGVIGIAETKSTGKAGATGGTTTPAKK